MGEVWDFRHKWPAEKTRIQADLHTGEFRFGLLDRITKAKGEEIDPRSARDHRRNLPSDDSQP